MKMNVTADTVWGEKRGINLKSILLKLYILLKNYFHPSFRESVRKVGILEEIKSSAEEREHLQKMIEDYKKSNEG